MNYDMVFEGPNQSDQLERVGGHVRHDRRLKMNRTMSDVSRKIDFGSRMADNQEYRPWHEVEQSWQQSRHRQGASKTESEKSGGVRKSTRGSQIQKQREKMSR